MHLSAPLGERANQSKFYVEEGERRCGVQAIFGVLNTSETHYTSKIYTNFFLRCRRVYSWWTVNERQTYDLSPWTCS
jgi:hypothetical protein